MTDDVITLDVTWKDILWEILSFCGLTFFYVKNCQIYKAFSKIASKDSGRFFMIIIIHFYNLTEMLVSRGIVMSMKRQLLSFLFSSTMSGVLAAMVLSVWRVMFHRMVTLSFLVALVGSYSYYHSFTSIPLYRSSSVCVQLPFSGCVCIQF